MPQQTDLHRYTVPLQLAASDSKTRREYPVRFIQAGRVQRADGTESNWEIPSETLKKAVAAGIFEDGTAVFVDHASIGTWFHPSLTNLAGVIHSAQYIAAAPAGVDGVIRLYDREDLNWLASLLDQIASDIAAGEPVPDIGLSLVFFGRHDRKDIGEEPGEEFLRITTEITKIQSIDLVFGPGLEGRLKAALSKYTYMEVTMPDEQIVTPPPTPTPAAAPAPTPDPQDPPITHDHNAVALDAHTHNIDPLAAQHTDRLTRIEETLAQTIDGIAALTLAFTQQEERNVIDEMGMGQAPRQPAQLQGGWLNSLDQIELAYEQLMGLPVNGKVNQLSGIKELYLLLTGDRGFQGRIDRDLIPNFLAYSPSGANADTTTMAELTRNVMNKRLVQQLDLLQEYNWWKPIVFEDNFNSLQQISWVRNGGIGYSSGIGLPTVVEKGEYQQLLWEDERTTGDWVKKGGYLPLSLEMIDRDDLAGWRDVPRQLALAQVVTISSIISAIFTNNSGSGAAIGDGVGDGFAFNTTRGNLINQPLDQPNWGLAVETMYKLSQLLNASVSESRRIAARPSRLLVPIELEDAGITATTSAVKAGTLADRQATRRILREEDVITVPHWTNANNWAALADPNLIPFIGVGYRFGENPEIFDAAQGNHILWLHDVLPIKTRWFFAVSVINTRGAIKSNN